MSPIHHLSKRLTRSVPGSDARGMATVTVAVLLAGLLGFAALALDISSLLLVRNELQNAADAGALAGAGELYQNGEGSVNAACNAAAVTAATANSAQSNAVEVNANTGSNTGDVQRGHWRWSDHSFTAADSLVAVVLNEVTNAELDANMNHINAVRVRARRQATPAVSFLSHLMGFSDFSMQAEGVGYIGFAGSLLPGEVFGPIVLCEEALLNAQGEYSCSTGRMINSGGGATHNTGGWTNFTQQPCATASSASTTPYVGCNSIPNPEISLQYTMGTTGGQLQNVFDSMMDCWEVTADSDADGRPDTVQNMTLPVIECPANNVGNCSNLVGAVNVNMLWMIRQAAANYLWIPTEMTGPGSFPDWVCPGPITGGQPFENLNLTQRQQCWEHFVAHFNLVNYAGTPITDLSPLSDLNKTMYFLPDCDVHVPVGLTAGPNLGVLARIPVLVK